MYPPPIEDIPVTGFNMIGFGLIPGALVVTGRF